MSSLLQVTAILPGLLTGLSLIVAIGAQNAYVLRQGLSRSHVGLIVAICAVSDGLLITAGVGGVGEVVRSHPGALTAMRWLGAAYLMVYGLRSLWSVRRPQTLDTSPGSRRGRWAAAATALALTYLNPHVYLDTVLMLGSIANQHGTPDRWWFASGAVLGSVVWFSSLGYGARVASPVLDRPATWRVIDLVIGIVMIGLGLGLLVG